MTDFPGYSDYFEALFQASSLLSVFQKKFQYTRAKGVDRLNGFQFATRAPKIFSEVSKKVLSGTFRFSPYRENLRLKSRDAAPRLIAIPTVRDRVVLHQVKDCLAFVFPECLPKNIASVHVRDLARELAGNSRPEIFTCGCDIKDFYGSIDTGRLLNLVGARLAHPLTVSLIARSLQTPTVPENARRRDYGRYVKASGIPQGLAISNILAAIYLRDVDEAMKVFGVGYRRYVDDILMYGGEREIRKAYKSLAARLRFRKLSSHPLGAGKSHISPLTKPFGYLGYHFKGPTVTVRDSTVERLLQSIAAKFSDYLHNKDRRLERFRYLDNERLKEIFLGELNDRISGAINEGKRYGWIAYFSEINDLPLLYRLDNIVAKMFERIPDFGHIPPLALKRFVRAFYEMKYAPHRGYVRDYDKISTRAEKLSFMQKRGRISPDEMLTDDQINMRFEAYKHRLLSKMLADEGMIY